MCDCTARPPLIYFFGEPDSCDILLVYHQSVVIFLIDADCLTYQGGGHIFNMFKDLLFVAILKKTYYFHRPFILWWNVKVAIRRWWSWGWGFSRSWRFSFSFWICSFVFSTVRFSCCCFTFCFLLPFCCVFIPGTECVWSIFVNWEKGHY